MHYFAWDKVYWLIGKKEVEPYWQFLMVSTLIQVPKVKVSGYRQFTYPRRTAATAEGPLWLLENRCHRWKVVIVAHRSVSSMINRCHCCHRAVAAVVILTAIVAADDYQHYSRRHPY